MKKLLCALLALALIACCAALAEAADLYGIWYGNMFGLSVVLDINEDGTYSMMLPEAPDDATTGTWELRGDKLIMDGDESVPLLYDGEKLILEDEGLQVVFTREPVRRAEVADALPDAPLEAFAGTWRSDRVGIGGDIVDTELLGEFIGARIDGTTLTLSGSLFDEDSVFDCTYADGALTYSAEGIVEGLDLNLVVRALADGNISIEITLMDEQMTFYMVPADAESESGASPAATAAPEMFAV